MFGKKKQTETDLLKGIIINQIEQLEPGRCIRYRLPKVYGGDLLVIELNPQYPEKKEKYVVSKDELVDGKPAGKRIHLFDLKDAKDVAGTIVSRGGELFTE